MKCVTFKIWCGNVGNMGDGSYIPSYTEAVLVQSRRRSVPEIMMTSQL